MSQLTLTDLSRAVRHVNQRLDRLDPRRASPHDDPARMLTRVAVCHFLGFAHKSSPDEIAAEVYRSRPDVGIALASPGKWLERAAASPASTSQIAWASELVQASNGGLVETIAAPSAYSALARRGVRLSFAGSGAVILPARSATPTLAAPFVAEGQPIPIKRLGLLSTLAKPKKGGIISLFSGELAAYSRPNIEAVIRDAMRTDSAAAFDGILLGTTAPSTVSPGGLLAGVTPIAASTGGSSTENLAGDLGALAAAIPAPGDLVFLMNSAELTRALVLAPGVAGLTIIPAPTLPSGTIVALDAADFYSGESDAPRFDVSEVATVHEEDTTPLAIGTAGTPPTVAAPSRSLYQTDSIGVRMLTEMTWGLRRANRIASVAGVEW